MDQLYDRVVVVGVEVAVEVVLNAEVVVGLRRWRFLDAGGAAAPANKGANRLLPDEEATDASSGSSSISTSVGRGWVRKFSPVKTRRKSLLLLLSGGVDAVAEAEEDVIGAAGTGFGGGCGGAAGGVLRSKTAFCLHPEHMVVNVLVEAVRLLCVAPCRLRPVIVPHQASGTFHVFLRR